MTSRGRRAWFAALAGILLVTLAGCDAAPSTAAPSQTSESPARSLSTDSTPPASSSRRPPGPPPFAPRTQLPRGGETIFPRYRVVACYGTAGSGALGVLGSEPPKQIVDNIEKATAGFTTPGREIQPAMELIVNVAEASPGEDGNYSHAIDAENVWRYEKVAEKNDMLLILDV